MKHSFHTLPEFLLFSSALLLASCANKPESTRPQMEVITESVYASGIVKSRNQYQVYASVNGVISNVLVTEGALVKKGDLLMTVRNEPSLLNAENARLAAARASLNANADKLKEAKVSIDLALAKLRSDSLLFVRQQNLRAQGIGTVVELEQRELAYKNAATNYQLALFKYKELQRDLVFTADQSKNNLRISESVAGDYQIRAASDGKVYKILKERGELATTLNPVAILGDSEDFYLELNVDEYDIARIQPDQPVLISMDSYKGQVFEGRVEKVEPLMNEQSKSFTVRALFTKRPQELYPNLSLEANIVIRSKQKALTIPRSYLLGDSLVLVGKDETRKVVVGIKDYRKVEILSGLQESDIIYKVNP